MSDNFNQPNPFGQTNPYASPMFGAAPNQNLIQAVKGKVMPPAIFLLIVGVIGLGFSIFNFVYALVAGPPVIDPNVPEFLRNMQQSAVGPVAVVMQITFVLVNVVIILGAVQMLRFKTRPLAITASILAMVNLGTCCCIIGLPAGIWSLVILLSKDVIAAFQSSSQ